MRLTNGRDKSAATVDAEKSRGRTRAGELNEERAGGFSAHGGGQTLNLHCKGVYFGDGVSAPTGKVTARKGTE